MLLTPREIKEALKTVSKRGEFIPGHTPSAVLMIFFNRQNNTHLVYIRRPQTMRIHSGNMAFPGGKIDPTDESSYAAALRETQEEIGLSPSQFQYLGQMGRFETLTSKYDAVAHSVWSPRIPSYRRNHHEVAEVIEIPLATLAQQFRADLDYNNHEEVMYLNFTYQSPHATRPANLWGLTARITHHFLAGILDLSSTRFKKATKS